MVVVVSSTTAVVIDGRFAVVCSIIVFVPGWEDVNMLESRETPNDQANYIYIYTTYVILSNNPPIVEMATLIASVEEISACMGGGVN